MPHEGRDAVERAGHGGEVLQRGAELTLPVHVGLAPQAAQQVVVLHRERDALADVLAEPGVDRAGVAAPHHEVDAPVGKVLEVGVLLSQTHRIVGGDEGGRGGQEQLVRACGDVGQQGRGRRWREGRVVVLPGGEEVQTCLLGQDRHLDSVLDALVLTGCLTGSRVGGDISHREDSELHQTSCFLHWIYFISCVLTEPRTLIVYFSTS